MGKFENTKQEKAQKNESLSAISIEFSLVRQGDSNPQPLAPEANAVLFTSLCFYCL